MYPEKEFKATGVYIKTESPAKILPPMGVFETGYSFEELMEMTPKEIAVLKNATMDILAAVRQTKFKNIATILWFQMQIEKERE